MRRGLFGFLLALVAGCTSPVEPLADLAMPAEPLVWPRPPAVPRIEFLYGFREPNDLGIRAPFFERLWDTIAGEKNRQMLKPYAVAAQGGRIVVTDPGLGVVHLFDLEAKSYARFLQAGKEQLRSPVGAVFGSDRIYVSDSALNKVFGFDFDGALALTIGGVERPTGLAYDPDSGRLFMAETLGHRISVFDDAGQRLFSFGERGEGAGQFNYPTHLSLRAGRLYVNDTMNFRLQIFDLDGRQVASFGRHGDGSGDFAQPKGLGVDNAGNVYVADAVFDRVQIFGDDGTFLLAFGGTGGAPGEFWIPTGLFTTGDRIYVADSYNRRIQVFRFLEGG